MTAVLFLGFIIGLQHALEADHVAAISSLVSRRSGVGQAAKHGVIWGIGHALTLLIVTGAVFSLEVRFSDSLASWLEFCVGLLLVGLGGHVLFRLWRDRIHFHTHRHGDGTVHFHAHSHRSERTVHGISRHDHVHPNSGWVRTLLVGLMHGLAGSAALIVLTAATVGEPVNGMLFIVLFALGSIVGMAALSAVIAIPLSFTAQAMTRANCSLQFAIGIATASIGVFVIGQSLPTFLSA